MNRALLLVLAAGCADDLPCADRRDLLQSEAGLVLTREEHAQGWGRTDCAQCHPAWTFHTEDCLTDVTVDFQAIDAEFPEDCVACHGANGVPGWQELLP
jgi:hypothetical protein